MMDARTERGLSHLRSCLKNIADTNVRNEIIGEVATLTDQLIRYECNNRIGISNPSERNRIIHSLNQIAMNHCQGRTFTDMCDMRDDPPPQPVPSPPPSNPVPPVREPSPTHLEIENQRRRLAIARQNLSYALEQQAMQGGRAYATPDIPNRIREARREISCIKRTLRAWGITVEDYPDDGNEPCDEPPPPPPPVDNAVQITPRFDGPLDNAVQITLRFRPGRDGLSSDQIEWHIPGNDPMTSDFRSPYPGDDLRVVIKALAYLQDRCITFNDDEKAILQNHALLNDGGTDVVISNANTIVGRKLYDALTVDRAAYAAISTATNDAIRNRRTISYVLRFPDGAVPLAALPWELLREQQNRPLLLIRGGQEVDSIERYVEVGGRAIPAYAPLDRPPHILVLSPHYGISDATRTDERNARNRTLGRLRERGLIDWDELSPVTAESLDRRMRDDTKPRPDFIHYFGHGIYQNGAGSLLFDGVRGDGDSVGVDRLNAILGDMRFILLQACESGMVGGEGLFTGIAPALSIISQAVVGMQLPVRISTAMRFQDVFYEQIARGRSLQTAVADARRSLFVIEEAEGGWAIPTLYIRSHEPRPIYLVQPR